MVPSPGVEDGTGHLAAAVGVGHPAEEAGAGHLVVELKSRGPAAEAEAAGLAGVINCKKRMRK